MSDISQGVVSTTAADDAAFEQHCQEDAFWTGGKLLLGAATFAFASIGFAYFYLRSYNVANLWRPDRVTAPTGVGLAIVGTVVAAAVVYAAGVRRFRHGLTTDWQVSGWITVLLGIVAVILQVWEFTRLPFAPGSSGYASTWVGWAVLNATFLLGTVYWSETLLARSIRLRRALAEDGGAAQSNMAPARLFRASVDGSYSMWWFIAAVNVIFWLLFYVFGR